MCNNTKLTLEMHQATFGTLVPLTVVARFWIGQLVGGDVSGLVLSLCMLAVNLLGDWLPDELDPLLNLDAWTDRRIRRC
jgi:hypothetical protein